MDETRWLTPEELQAWRKFIAVVEIVSRTLDSDLQREAQLTHFEYFVLAMLSEAEGRTLRMTALANETTATLARLSHVVARLEKRGYLTRSPCPQDRRATNATLTDAGWAKVVDTAPGHVRSVLDTVIEPLNRRDIADLDRIMGRILDQGRRERP